MFVLAAAAAASPRTPLRYGLPLPVLPPRWLAPDWMVRGDSFAQETRCPGVGNCAHVQAEFGDDDLGGVLGDAGDLVEAGDG